MGLFEKKKKDAERCPICGKEISLLLCASGLYTLHDVLQKNDWNEHEIENRAEWLLANAQNIWKI